ncbi:MAG TPA: molybdopterin converting factor subunit 1 [Gammaproteobacteria bacterium]|nr:molybdopterin converting factor subunit 1 [Gammaproteobacteria bacterium]
MTIRYFASLREQMGQSEARISSNGIHTVLDAWVAANGDREIPANVLVSINQDYARLDSPVQSGDEIAFFPPVTGG